MNLKDLTLWEALPLNIRFKLRTRILLYAQQQLTNLYMAEEEHLLKTYGTREDYEKAVKEFIANLETEIEIYNKLLGY